MTRARWLVLVFALLFPTVLTYVYFARPSSSAAGVYGAGKTLQFGLPILWWIIADRSRLRLPPPKSRGLISGAATGLAIALAILALFQFWLRQEPLVEPLREQVRIKCGAFGLTTPLRYLLFALFLSLIHALLEEYYWRAFVFAELRTRLNLRPAIGLSSLGFAAHHVVVLAVYLPGHFWTLAIPASLAVGLGGALWALMYHRYRSVYPAWLSHAIVDGALMAVGYLLVWGFNPPSG